MLVFLKVAFLKIGFAEFWSVICRPDKLRKFFLDFLSTYYTPTSSKNLIVRLFVAPEILGRYFQPLGAIKLSEEVVAIK